jgi:hypothetical protein
LFEELDKDTKLPEYYKSYCISIFDANLVHSLGAALSLVCESGDYEVTMANIFMLRENPCVQSRGLIHRIIHKNDFAEKSLFRYYNDSNNIDALMQFVQDADHSHRPYNLLMKSAITTAFGLFIIIISEFTSCRYKRQDLTFEQHLAHFYIAEDAFAKSSRRKQATVDPVTTHIQLLEEQSHLESYFHQMYQFRSLTARHTLRQCYELLYSPDEKLSEAQKNYL